MKKAILLSTLLLAFLLTACNRTPASAPNGNVTPTTTTAPLVSESNGVTYQNSHFGITFTPADGWDLFDTDEMADSSLPTLPIEAGESYVDALARVQTFYDMYALHEESDGTIALQVENIPALYDFTPTAEEYRAIQISMFEGAPNLTYESFDATVDGQTHPALKVLWGAGEEVRTDVFVYLSKGNYMLSIKLSSFDGDHAAEWLSWFELL